MKKIAQLVKSFTLDPTQGNPAGVILNARDLTDPQMQAIALQLGFSESAFIQASQKADCKVRFFSPTQEVDLCAHASIAALHALAQAHVISATGSTFENKAGIIALEQSEDGLISMTQQEPQFLEHEVDRQKITALLNISSDALMDFPVQIVSTGTPKLLIPLKYLTDLYAIKPNLEGIACYCKQSSARGFYPFTLETLDPHSDAHARQFNPLAGINEDPITGIAGGALAAYLVHYQMIHKNDVSVEQGYVLNKGGKIMAQVRGNSVKVGGFAVTFGTQELVI